MRFMAPDGQIAMDLTDGQPIYQNGDLSKHTFLLRDGVWEGKEKTTLAHFRFRPFVLMTGGYRISVTLHDDFTKLFDHTFKLEGYRLNI